MAALDLNDIATIVAMVLGTSGFVLGIISYLRDRPIVKVTLQWDMSVLDYKLRGEGKLCCLIRVTNVGRRPIYVSHVALEMPKGSKPSHWLIKEGVVGNSLSEGCPPQLFHTNQKGLEAYAAKWRDIRGQVTDSSGKVWRSKKLSKKIIPSWATIKT